LLLALEKQENSKREKTTAAVARSRTDQTVSPSFPPKKEGRSEEVCQALNTAAAPLETQALKQKSGISFISKKKFLLSSQKVAFPVLKLC
jgi:hypothetical protein